MRRSARCPSAGSSASRSSRPSIATRGSSCSTSRPPSSRRRPKRSSSSCGASSEGHSIVFISHKLYEVLEIADRIAVIRRGRVVGERTPPRPTRTTSPNSWSIARSRSWSTGASPTRATGPHGQRPRGGRRRGHRAAALGRRLRGPARRDARHRRRRRQRAGRARAGAHRPSRSRIGRSPSATLTSPAGGRADIYRSGVAYVPADRHRFGLVLSFPVADNLVLTSYHRRPYSRGIIRDDAAVQRTARMVKAFDILRHRLRPRPARLSSGNQQKVVIARVRARPTVAGPR